MIYAAGKAITQVGCVEHADKESALIAKNHFLLTETAERIVENALSKRKTEIERWGRSMFKRKNKFGAVKVETDGRRFDSMLERSVYALLKADPNVEILKCQETVYLGPTRYCYRPDFKIRLIKENSEAHVEAKGFAGGRWPQTKKQWKAFGPDTLFIWTGSHLKPKLTEIIGPGTHRTSEMNLSGALCAKCGGNIA